MPLLLAPAWHSDIYQNFNQMSAFSLGPWLPALTALVCQLWCGEPEFLRSPIAVSQWSDELEPARRQMLQGRMSKRCASPWPARPLNNCHSETVLVSKLQATQGQRVVAFGFESQIAWPRLDIARTAGSYLALGGRRSARHHDARGPLPGHALSRFVHRGSRFVHGNVNAVRGSNALCPKLAVRLPRRTSAVWVFKGLDFHASTMSQ